MDPVLLARIQFATNISFHILFPTITIALGWVLVYFKWRESRSLVSDQGRAWREAYNFWVKVFALSFGLGVVSGVTMSFQFGTNWPGYMETVGDIAGPLLAYEVLTAFFLEAAFLAIMLFGRDKVSNFVHTLATVLVAAGTTLSAFWIIALDSWMQTPAGFRIENGAAIPTDWLEIIFNPSMPYRLTHMLIASGLTVSFLIAGVSALRVIWGDRSEAVKRALNTAVCAAAVLIPVQIFVGDLHGLNTLEHQPAKVAAMEANWETGPYKPLILFAWPNEETRENNFEISIPSGASLILKHSADGVVPGLNDFVLDDGTVRHPPVAPVFFAFRVMVGIGFLMLAAAWYAAYRLWRYDDLGYWGARFLVGMTFSGWVATLAGWYVTEIGRQPWLATDILLTSQAAAPHPAPLLGLSLAAYLIVYAALLSAYLLALWHLAQKASGKAGLEFGSPAKTAQEAAGQ